MFLDAKNQYGLLCELFVLEKLIKVFPSTALSYWQKPNHLEYDFILNSWLLEVKATVQREHKHTISSLEQLSCPVGKKLAIVSFKLNDFSGITLREKVDELDKKYFLKKPKARKLFYTKLAERKYFIFNKQDYDVLKFSIKEERFYTINNETPKIVRSSFKKPLTSAITNVKYDLNFEGQAYQELSKIDFSKLE